jgi:hypothetical protein
MFDQVFNSMDDVLWREAGRATEPDYTEQTLWMLFSKYLDDLEHEGALGTELVGKSCGALDLRCYLAARVTLGNKQTNGHCR